MAVEYPRQVFCEWGNQANISAEFSLQEAKEQSGTPPHADA